MNILIADDQRAILRTYQILCEWEGYKVFTADTPEKAKKIFQERKIQIGIFDFDFGEGENGIDLLLYTRRFRENFPIILNTSSPNSAETFIGNLSPQDQELLSPLLICFKMTIDMIKERIDEVLLKT